jgi:hypothetical protein
VDEADSRDDATRGNIIRAWKGQQQQQRRRRQQQASVASGSIARTPSKCMYVQRQ